MAENINGKEIIEIKSEIVKHFGKSEWLELAYLTNCQDIIDDHPRLLRSLSFGDDDYEGNVLEVVSKMVKKNPEVHKEIKEYLAHKFSQVSVSEFVSTAHTEIPKRIISFSPQVFDVPTKQVDDKLVAVMMPFRPEFIPTFDAIKNACFLVAFDCKKANDIWENSTFIQDIFELIFTSKIVVADFTGKNPNVFYEVGIAHTLGKTVIPITQSIEDVPADLRHHRILKYLPNKEGFTELETELVKRLKTLKPKDEITW